MKRKIKRKIKLFKRFWREWGLSKDEAVDLLGAIAFIAFIIEMPILAEIIAILF